MKTFLKTKSKTQTKLLVTVLLAGVVGFSLAGAGFPIMKKFNNNRQIKNSAARYEKQAKEFPNTVDLEITSFDVENLYDVNTGKITQKIIYTIKNNSQIDINKNISTRSFAYYRDKTPAQPTLEMTSIIHDYSFEAGESFESTFENDLTPTNGNADKVLAELEKVDAYVVKVDFDGDLFESDENNNTFWIGTDGEYGPNKSYDFAVVDVKVSPYSRNKSLVTALVANLGKSAQSGSKIAAAQVISPYEMTLISKTNLKLKVGEQKTFTFLVNKVYHKSGQKNYGIHYGINDPDDHPENDMLPFGMYIGPNNVMDQIE
ncbi:hypothetical protein HQ571_03630 [Candidatus Kuenenbacteria bacterium]|nr:hypothetical protein [Candidatus Kuenenbacteria bacterium]